MNPDHRLNHAVRSELMELVRLGLMGPARALAMSRRYPVDPFSPAPLAKSVMVLGVLVFLAGVFYRFRAPGLALAGSVHAALPWMSFWLFGAFLVGVFALWSMFSCVLRECSHGFELACAGSFVALTGLILAHDFAHIGRWPLLVGFDALIFTLLAYLLKNPGILSMAVAALFAWLLGFTGYLSQWGLFWNGFDYPVRVLMLGGAMLLLALVHLPFPSPTGRIFARVYAHFGIVTMNIAYWFLALFGHYVGAGYNWGNAWEERILFSVAWLIFAGYTFFIGMRFKLDFLRAYGLAFIVVNLVVGYTQFIALPMPGLWWMHLALAIGSLSLAGYQIGKQGDKSGSPQSARPLGLSRIP